jgi:hypothetical protein
MKYNNMKMKNEIELRKQIADGQAHRRAEGRKQHICDMALRPDPRIERLSARAVEAREIRLLNAGARAFTDVITHSGDGWGEEA